MASKFWQTGVLFRFWHPLTINIQEGILLLLAGKSSEREIASTQAQELC
jgi:hypothetical protein